MKKAFTDLHCSKDGTMIGFTLNGIDFEVPISNFEEIINTLNNNVEVQTYGNTQLHEIIENNFKQIRQLNKEVDVANAIIMDIGTDAMRKKWIEYLLSECDCNYGYNPKYSLKQVLDFY